MLEIGCRAKGLVDMSEDELRAISSGIELDGSNIAVRRSDFMGGQHVNRSGNTPKERTMRRRLRRSVG